MNQVLTLCSVIPSVSPSGPRTGEPLFMVNSASLQTLANSILCSRVGKWFCRHKRGEQTGGRETQNRLLKPDTWTHTLRHQSPYNTHKNEYKGFANGINDAIIIHPSYCTTPGFSQLASIFQGCSPPRRHHMLTITSSTVSTHRDTWITLVESDLL